MNYNEMIKKISIIKQKKPILFDLERDETVNCEDIIEGEKFYNISFPDSYKTILKEIGDYIGFNIVDKKCVEEIVLWNHDERTKTKLKGNFYDVMVKLGLYNESLDY